MHDAVLQSGIVPIWLFEYRNSRWNSSTDAVLAQKAERKIDATLDAPQTIHPGTVIAGRYKLLEAIGEGGMGSVWVAEQSQPIRKRPS